MAPRQHALVVADGDVDVALLVELVRDADPPPWLIAADGGAARVLGAGLTPDVVVGDFDSLTSTDRARLDALGVELRLADRDKDESDMELCLLAALEADAGRVTILGALGLVRPEHSVANLLLLTDARLDGVEVVIAGRGSRIWRIGGSDGPGQTRIEGEPGDFVSLFPVGGPVDGVTTTGLRFPLAEATLPPGPSLGLSNELLGQEAQVTTGCGCLLVVHTHHSMSDAPPTGGT